MERQINLKRAPMEEIVNGLERVEEALRQGAFDEQKQAVSQLNTIYAELATPRRLEELTRYAQETFGEQLEVLVAEKQAKIQPIADVENALSKKRLNEAQRQALYEQRDQLLPRKEDQRILDEVALHALAAIVSPGQLADIYKNAGHVQQEKLQKEKKKREEKEARNKQRIVQLTRIVVDMHGNSTNSVGWEEVAFAMASSDRLLETRLQEANDFWNFWQHEIPFRLDQAAAVIKLKMQQGIQLTSEEQDFTKTLGVIYNVSSPEATIAIIDNQIRGDNGVIEEWKKKEIGRGNPFVTALAVQPDVKRDLVVFQPDAESSQPVVQEGVVWTEEELALLDQWEREEQQEPQVNSQPEPSTERRDRGAEAKELHVREIVNLLRQYFPEYIQRNASLPKDLVIPRFKSFPTDYHVSSPKINSYVDNKDLERTPRSNIPLFNVSDVVEMIVLNLKNTTPSLADAIKTECLFEIERMQIDYQLGQILPKLAYILTGIDMQSTTAGQIKENLQWYAQFRESISPNSNGTFNGQQLSRFNNLKGKTDFREAGRNQIAIIGAQTPNVIPFLSYLFELQTGRPVSAEQKQYFTQQVGSSSRLLIKQMDDFIKQNQKGKTSAGNGRR